ncbi:MAG: hypothetical protein QM696_10360 [Steroidobacteraceae bacterium]
MADRSELEVLEILEAPPGPAPVDYLPPSWLVATGQDRYLRWMMLMTFCGAGLVVLRWIGQYPALHVPRALLGWVGGFAAVLVCGGLLVTLLAIRCRVCGCHVALHFIRREKFLHWIQALQDAKGCPRCGHHPAGGPAGEAP